MNEAIKKALEEYQASDVNISFEAFLLVKVLDSLTEHRETIEGISGSLFEIADKIENYNTY